jgi:hypothetical protein
MEPMGCITTEKSEGLMVIFVVIIIITEQAFVCDYGSRTCTITQSEDYTISVLFSPAQTCIYWASVLLQKVSKCV